MTVHRVLGEDSEYGENNWGTIVFRWFYADYFSFSLNKINFSLKIGEGVGGSRSIVLRRANVLYAKQFILYFLLNE